ncbi:MAG: hypothetical protein KKA64_04015 [Nanoarchaeota archaeon]|nr:hypothetical protein [Nanoarchaeota archaeon]
MPIKILNRREKQEILENLRERFGIQEIPFMLAQFGKEKIFAFSGDLSERQLREIEQTAFVECMGVYFAKIDERTKEIRLSIEGSQLLKNQITENIFELENEEQLNQWMKGQDLQISTGKRGFFIIKYKEDFLGSGKASENKIGNFIPKNRRLKN